ncbi:HAD hydrolase family protein [Candidatus Babeliales bacterium]|nr:HAD hydrolase family protein [Candidatus Babeliales bacterium]MCF7899826.1 HAD hydrolase family protein [Candidatus Babeliales bacterium]
MTDKKWFKNCIEDKKLVSKIEKIKLIVTDIDGALTDGYLYLTPDRTDPVSKKFSVQDGFAINEIIKNYFLKIAFLSGRNDAVTKIRAKMLGIPEDMCIIGSTNKPEKIKILQKDYKISKEETLHFGDDFLDYQVKEAVNIFACPENAPFYIKCAADLIIPKNSNNNAFRLLLDLILYVQRKHFVQDLITESLK